jgi:heterotetrameric sarcosine oxidase beta subunit
VTGRRGPAAGAATLRPHGRVIPGACPRGLRRAYDVVIVGAGVQGLALAYDLTRRGIGRVAVLDAAYPGAGASGRNGELIRSAFASPEWIGLFDDSLQRWRTLSAELDFNVLFTPSGYLVLAGSDEELAAFRGHVRRQHESGLRTRLLDAAETREAAPALASGLARGAMYQPDAGFAHHDAVVWAYAAAASRLGAEIHPYTEVTGVETSAGAVTGVSTPRGHVAAPFVVDAAGGMAADLARLAGVELPLRSFVLEAMVTEPLRPFLRPAVSSPAHLAYCHQTTRGEFVGGTEPRRARAGQSLRASLAGARDMAAKFTQIFPALAGARMMRQWAGVVSQTEDAAPLLGRVPELEGLVLDCGWVYGFMGAPAGATLLGELIATGRAPALLARFGLERLRRGDLIVEPSLVVSTGEDT